MACWQSQLYPGKPWCVLCYGCNIGLSKAPAQNENINDITKHYERVIPEASGPTQFLDDKEVAISKKEAPMDISFGLKQNASSGFQQSIATFLEKPILLKNGLIDVTSVAGTQIRALDLPKDMINATLYTEKLSGFFAFRATIVLRLQVNANRFQAGRLIMTYVPQGQIAGTMPYRYTQDLTPLTMLPNVQLDIACETESILEIPYVSPYVAYDLINGVQPHGVAFLHIYEPLALGTGGATNFEYAIWANFKDVELFSTTIGSSFWSFQVNVGRRTRVGRKRLIDNVLHEEKKAQPGPFESVASIIEDSANALSGVPLLSDLAKPVAWVSGALKNVASHFGWSKPPILGPTVSVQKTLFRNYTNADGGDSNQVLALRSDNEVGVLPGLAGTDLDEMNIARLCSIPAYSTGFTWAAVDAIGTNKYQKSLHPTNFIRGTTVTVGAINYDCRIHIPCSFFGIRFSQWRGSFKYRLKFVKTEFHSGRLLIAFVPGLDAGYAFSDTNQCHRAIIDIRECSEYEFVAPWVSAHPWLDQNLSYGSVVIYVMNPLVAPASVTQDITVVVEVSMVNAEFSVPIGCPEAPMLTAATVAAFTPQVDDGTLVNNSPDVCNIAVQEGIGNSIVPAPNIESSLYCVGEKVSSILQLMKRNIDMSYNLNVITLSGWPGTSGELSVRPFTSGCWYASGTSSTTKAFCAYDFISLFSSMFAYNRGSVRYKIGFSTASGGTVDFYKTFYDKPATLSAAMWLNTNDITLANSYFYGGGAAIPYKNDFTGGIDVQIPMYHPLLARYNFPDYSTPDQSSGAAPTSDMACQYMLSVVTDVSLVANKPKATLFSRSAGDDFQLLFFLSIPLMCYGTH